MKKVISEIKEKHNRVLKLFISSIAFAFAISLIVNYVCNRSNDNLWQLFVGCGIIFSICIIYFIVVVFNRNKSFHYESSFIIDENKTLIDIPNYEIISDMVYAMEDAFTENEGLKNVWMQNTLNSLSKQNDANSSALLKELIEYCLLQRMSMYTEDYFNNLGKGNYFSTYSKDDLSTIILNNRFIKLFSEPIENRKSFVSSDYAKDDHNGTIVALYNAGARYEIFEFALPKKARIKKYKNDTVVFSFRHFDLSIKVTFKEMGSVIPVSFIKDYVGLVDYDLFNYKCYEFDVDIIIKEKIRALFIPFKKAEYGWIDGFLDEINEYVSFSYFLDKIHWDYLEAQILIFKNTGEKK